MGFFVSSQEIVLAAELPREIRSIAVQHNGRVKSFEGFARQTLRLVAGKESWEKRSAASVLWSIAQDRPAAAKLALIRLDFPELKDLVGVDKDRHFFSHAEVAGAYPQLLELSRSASAKRDKDERPTALEQKASQLLGRVHTVGLLISGDAFTVIPPPTASRDLSWSSGFNSKNPASKPFADLLAACRPDVLAQACSDEAHKWNAAARAVSPQAAKAKISAELFYLNFRPFQWAWILYLLGFLVMASPHSAGAARSRKAATLGIALIAGGWIFHTLGLALRVIVLDRPPVSNMYESMIFMNWALMLFAFGFAGIRRAAAPLVASSLISVFIEIYANLLPIDPSMDVLVPVLRSNYWLTIHVLTIVSSYGAFGLAMALGHRHLIFSRLLSKWSPKETDDSARLLLRVIEFGAILVGTGTVLGGIWANESWGRFWGWDPKETWALITLLGYLALIHLRYFKKIGPFGLAIGTIIGFQLVLFTWYGVNFVLGRGLHSYGSGSGGMQWILYYLAAQTVFLLFLFLKKSHKVS